VRYRISTPVKGYDGVVAGVHFRDGVGETDNEAVVPYFRRQRYGVEQLVDEPAAQEPKAPIGPPSPPVVVPPAGAPDRGATKAAWVKFATAPEQGMPAAEAEAMTRDQLADKFLGPKTQEGAA
jgi:hypothetical protein